MANLSQLEKRQFEDLFEMRSGYIVDSDMFSNSTFADFFSDCAKINIYDDKYAYGSGSKANRLRAFWDQEDNALVGKVLTEMLAIYAYHNDNVEANKAYVSCMKTAQKLAGKNNKETENEDDFLDKDFGSVSFDKLAIEVSMTPIMKARYEEALKGLKSNSPMSVIFMCGSMLEGILLGTALSNPTVFTNSKASPKYKDGKTKPLQDWTLANFIDVSCDIELLGQDVKKFSHAMRDFRNYIHPYEQLCSGFNPDHHTAKICMQVLNAAIASLSGER